jgi:arylsulfatase
MRPNFLVLFPGAWRHDWLGCAGGIGIQTPALDALAARGVRFTQCVTPSPLCAPARAALALGCDYQSCGVLDNNDNLALDRPNFYRNLREAGYSVGGVGKFDLAKGLDDHGGDGFRLLHEWGFTHGRDSEGKWDGVREMQRVPITGPYGRFLDALGLRDRYLADMEDRRNAVGLYSSRASPLDTKAYGDDWVSRSAIEMIRSFPSDRPWFAQVNFPGPHDPFDAPSWVLDRIEQLGLPEAVRHGGFDNETMR